LAATAANVPPKPVQTAPAPSAPLTRPTVSVAANTAPPASNPVRFDLGTPPPAKTGAIEVNQVERDRAAAAPTAKPAALPPPPPQQSLEQAFAEFEKVDRTAAPAPGAVDVRALKPALEAVAKPAPPKPAKAAKPARPKNPSRIWVQVATGGNRKALGQDWDRITDKAKMQFRGKKGYLVDWGRTNRLVTGPFTDEDKAQDFVTELKKAGISTFMFTSDDGEEVAPLGGK
jgi:hypothetical protein